MSFFAGLDTAIGEALVDAETTNYADPDPGTYVFEIIGMELKVGTKNNPDAKNFIIHYTLTDDDGKDQAYNEWLRLPDVTDPKNVAPADATALSIMKQRFLSLGIAESDINTFGPDDVEGITGTLQIVWTKPKQPGTRDHFVNIRNLKVKETVVKPAIVTTKPSSRKATPVAKATGSEDAPTKPSMTGAVGNPFAR